MKLLHTSDWHFGKRFQDVDMIPLQEKFCDWLVGTVTEEKVDCVLIAGDVYDRSNPKEDAVELLDDVLHRLSSAGASIVMISGNHDSAERLNFGTRFMTGGGLHVRTERRDLSVVADPVVITGRDGHDVEILPLPYLDPDRVAATEGVQRNHESVLQAVIDNQKARLRDPARTIAMAHAFVTGGAESESERILAVGGSGAVRSSLFDGFGYVALGHLHRPQQIGGEALVYSGTPMPYSFSEDDPKSVRLIEAGPAGIRHEMIPCSAGRDVVTVSDTLENVLKEGKYERHKGSFVRVRLTDANFQVGAMDSVRKRFPHILVLEQEAMSNVGSYDAEELKALAQRSKEDVVNAYVEETWPDGLTPFGRELVDGVIGASLKGDEG